MKEDFITTKVSSPRGVLSAQALSIVAHAIARRDYIADTKGLGRLGRPAPRAAATALVQSLPRRRKNWLPERRPIAHLYKLAGATRLHYHAHVNVHMSFPEMRSERLTILVTSEEKRRLTALAKRRHVSVGELVRSAVGGIGERESMPVPTAEQIRVLEQAADTAVAALQRAGRALDRAETELTRTRAYFASKAGEVRESGEETPRTLLYRALARAQGRSR